MVSAARGRSMKKSAETIFIFRIIEISLVVYLLCECGFHIGGVSEFMFGANKHYGRPLTKWFLEAQI